MSTGSDTIAAIATPQGRGGIGVVRVSGADLKLLARGLIGALPPARRATRAEFLDAAGQPIDDGVALYFSAPASYTGEEVLELQGHGGPVVMQMLLKRCVELGARLAEPGEFTRRAFLNDKLDLAQAEGVADLIEAATEAAVRCARRSLSGDFSRAVEDLVQQTTDLRMRVESALDFPEEDIEAEDTDQVRVRLARLRTGLEKARASARQGSILRSGLQVVLAGQPNVGKSSLLNQLAGEELAIVTPIPGTTRDSLRQIIQIAGVPVNIVDTAGLRDTHDEVESLGVARSWFEIGRADVLLLVIEDAQGMMAADRDVLARVPQTLPRLIVHNKIDLSGNAARAASHHGETTVFLSAKTGAGVEALRSELLRIAGWQEGVEELFMARERHIEALRAAAGYLSAAEELMSQRELFAEELRLTQRELSTISGEFTADDLLGEIFSRFCIGK
ncbi:MAG: tRNA uridine-5-carboxymethylaminomethyl(34) synthesis GTPase MnmE [Betaproteobacteria bacterium]|nr:tRNA uridine-5-carboxymethylaminomethyl(34) synthesis GTPase MnmE [Betaproteobacteria bacterium]